MICDLRVQSASARCGRTGYLPVLLAVCIAVLAAPAVSASNSEATVERRGLILTMNRPLDSDSARLFRGVVSQSVRWGLERRQLAVLESSELPAEQAAAGDPADLLQTASDKQVDFILLTEYASRGSDLEIRMAWYDPKSGEKTQEVIRRGRKDLVLDKIIREALNELLAGVESSLSSLEPRQISVSESPVVASAAGFNSSAADGGATVPNASAIQPPAAGAQMPAPSIPGSTVAPASGTPASGRVRHFELAVGCAPFVATGVASEYFKLGVMPAVNLSYLLQGKISRLALGLYGGLNAFTAAGDLSSAQTFLIPVGASVRYEIGAQNYPSAVFGIAAGPALLMMNSSSDDTLLGLTVFGRGTLGVRLPIGSTFAVVIEAGYDVYLEQPQPIMGFSPAVFTTIRL